MATQTAAETATPNANAGQANTAPASVAPANGSEQKPDEKKFTQADIDAILKERLERADKAAAKKAEDASKKAADDAAAKNGEWQKLAETRAAELAATAAKLVEFEAAQKRLTDYEAVIKAQTEAAKKDLPAHILTLLNALEPVKQLEWLAANADALGKKPTQTVPGTPPPANGVNVTEAETKRRQSIEAARVRSYT